MKRKIGAAPGKELSIKSFGPAIICFIIVFILVVMPDDSLPGKEKSEWWHWVWDITYLDKLVHLIMFAITTFFFLLPISESNLFKKVKRQYFFRIALSMCIWGLTTEFIQRFYCPTRTFDLLDWAADSAGVLLAVIYCRKFHSF